MYHKSPIRRIALQESQLQTFPDEILLYILGFVRDPKDFSSISTVCYKFHQIAQDERLWPLSEWETQLVGWLKLPLFKRFAQARFLTRPEFPLGDCGTVLTRRRWPCSYDTHITAGVCADAASLFEAEDTALFADGKDGYAYLPYTKYKAYDVHECIESNSLDGKEYPILYYVPGVGYYERPDTRDPRYDRYVMAIYRAVPGISKRDAKKLLDALPTRHRGYYCIANKGVPLAATYNRAQGKVCTSHAGISIGKAAPRKGTLCP